MPGPGDPDFDAEMRRRWLVEMRRLLPDLTDEKFDEVIAEFDKIKDKFVADLEASRRTSEDTDG